MELILIHVGIGQMRIARSPARLMCVGLGSCVAVALWDSSTKIGGMVHIMLPDSKISKKSEVLPGKYADTAAKALLEEMKVHGANQYVTVAKIAGGANMFKNVSVDMKDIGSENAKAAKKSLIDIHIRLLAEDTGGTLGRTVELDTTNGNLIIRNIRGRTITI